MENSWRAFLVFFLVVGVVFGQTNNNAGPNGFNSTQPLTVSARAYHGGWYAIQNADVEAVLKNFDPLDRHNNNSWEFDVYDASHRLATSYNSKTPLWYQTWSTLYCRSPVNNNGYTHAAINEPCNPGSGCNPNYQRICNIPPREGVIDSEHLVVVPTLGKEGNFGTKITNLTICPRYDVDWFEVKYGRSKPAIYTTEIYSKQMAKDAPGSKQGIVPVQFDQFTLSRISPNAPAYQSALWMETHYTDVNVTRYHGITGGKDRNRNFYYVTGRNEWVPDVSLQRKDRNMNDLTNNYFRGDSFYKGQYSIHVKEETKCPTQHGSFSTQRFSPKILNSNKTFHAFGFLCNGEGYTDTVRAHYWRYQFDSGRISTSSASSTPRQIFIVRAKKWFSVPEKDNFEASIRFGLATETFSSANNQLLQKYGCVDSTNPYRCNKTLTTSANGFYFQDLSSNTGSGGGVNGPTVNTRKDYDLWIQMNWTHNGRDLANNANTQGSRMANDTWAPPGYLGYSAYFERCPRDWMEPGNGRIFVEGGNAAISQTTYEAFSKINSNKFIRCETQGTNSQICSYTVQDLTICPLYGPNAAVTNTSSTPTNDVAFTGLWPVMGDPDNYEVDVRDQYPGYLTATLSVQKGGFCLQPDWQQQEAGHTDEGLTDFKELQTAPTGNGGQYTAKATVIAGWGRKYQLKTFFCAGFPTNDLRHEPDNSYDWFRNYTETDVLQYNIEIRMVKQCPYGGLTRSNNANTSVTDIGFQSGKFRINPTFTDSQDQWLCRQALNGETGNPYTADLDEAWYSITTQENYTYFNVTLNPIWWAGSNNNGGNWGTTKWPRYKMSIWADCTNNATACPTNPVAIQTSSPSYTAISMYLRPWNGGLDRPQSSSTQTQKYLVKVEMDWPTGSDPKYYPFLNFRLTVNALDCKRDKAEGTRALGQQQNTNDIFTRSFDVINDRFGAAARLSPTLSYTNNSFTICGYKQGDTQMASSANNQDPSLDVDYYKFTLTGSTSNNIRPTPGLVNISLTQITGDYSHWNMTDRRADLRLDVFTNSESNRVIPGSNTIGAIGFDVPFGYDTPANPTSFDNSNQTRKDHYNWGLYKSFVTETQTTFNFKVWSDQFHFIKNGYKFANIKDTTHRGYGSYQVKITYTQDCPRAFGSTNNSRVQNNGVPEAGTSVDAQKSGVSGRWSISADVAPSSDDANIVRTGASWIGNEQLPWNCLNPQTFKVVASRNATRLKLYYYRKFKYTNTPQLQLTIYDGATSQQYRDFLTAHNYPYDLPDNTNVLTQVIDLQLRFHDTNSRDYFIVIRKPNVNNFDWTAFDIQTEWCQQDRYDWNYTIIKGQIPVGDTATVTTIENITGGGVQNAHPIHVWNLDCTAQECGGSPYAYSPPSTGTGIFYKRINTTSAKAFVNNMNLCFTADDKDAYELIIDDWTTDLANGASATASNLPSSLIRPQGFLRTWVKSKKLPVTVEYPNDSTGGSYNSQPSTEEHPLAQAPHIGTKDSGENWLTSSWTVIDQSTVATTTALAHRRHKKIVQVRGNNMGVNANRYVQTDYDIEWKYQYRCPIADDWGVARETNEYGEVRNLGMNNGLENAYRIPTPKCSDENYIWNTGYQFLCSDKNPYVGSQAHYYFVKNLVPGLMKTSIWLNASTTHTSTGTGTVKHSLTNSDVTYNCAGGDGTASHNVQFAPIQLSIWKNSGVNSLTGKPDILYIDGCSKYNTTKGTLDLVLGMGTHIIKVERLLDNSPAYFYRDYHFSIKMEYCGCPTLAQTGDKHVNIQFTRIAGHNGTLSKNEVDDFIVQLEKYLGLPTGTVFFFRQPTANSTVGSGVFDGSIGFEGITEEERTAAIEKLKNTPTNVTESRTPIGGFHVTSATTVSPPPAPSPTQFTPLPTTATPAPTDNDKCYSRETVIWLGVWLGLFGVAFLVTLGIVIALSSGAAGSSGGNDSYHLHPR